MNFMTHVDSNFRILAMGDSVVPPFPFIIVEHVDGYSVDNLNLCAKPAVSDLWCRVPTKQLIVYSRALLQIFIYVLRYVDLHNCGRSTPKDGFPKGVKSFKRLARTIAEKSAIIYDGDRPGDIHMI